MSTKKATGKNITSAQKAYAQDAATGKLEYVVKKADASKRDIFADLKKEYEKPQERTRSIESSCADIMARHPKIIDYLGK